MSANDYVGIAVGIATIFLLWQQNRIFKKQNEIFAKQEGVPMPPSRTSRIRNYWPLLAMIALTGATWATIGLNYLYPTSSSFSIPPLAYVCFLLFICAAIGLDIYDRYRWKKTDVEYNQLAKELSVPSKLVIHSALYGDGSMLDMDVRDKLEQLNHGAIAVHVSNGTFGCDPVPNVPKTLRVKYSYGNPHSFEASRPENAFLVLPEDSWLRQRSDQLITAWQERDVANRRVGELAAETNQANARADAAKRESAAAEEKLSRCHSEAERLMNANRQLQSNFSNMETVLSNVQGLIKDLEETRKQFGRWRIIVCGKKDESLNLSVAVQFIDPQDAGLAEKIRALFWSNIPGHPLPWDSQPIDPIKWRKNPSEYTRIVIFSEQESAQCIKAAINDCGVLDERVEVFPRQNETDYVAEITFVIFPRAASSA